MSPAFLLQQFAPGMIAGALVAFAVSITMRWLRVPWMKQAAAACAVGGGYAVGHAKTVGWPGFPPGDATHWLLFSAIAAILVGFVYGMLKDKWAAGRAATFAVLLLGTLTLLLMPKFKHGWTVAQGAIWLTALALAGLLMGWALDRNIRTGERRFSLAWFAVITTGASVALATTGSMVLGQFAAVLSAVIIALIAAAMIGTITERAVTPCLGTLFIGLITCGYFYSELPWTSALLLVLSPAAGSLVRGEASVTKELLRAVIVMLPVGVAVALAFRASPPMEYY